MSRKPFMKKKRFSGFNIRDNTLNHHRNHEDPKLAEPIRVTLNFSPTNSVPGKTGWRFISSIPFYAETMKNPVTTIMSRGEMRVKVKVSPAIGALFATSNRWNGALLRRRDPPVFSDWPILSAASLTTGVVPENRKTVDSTHEIFVYPHTGCECRGLGALKFRFFFAIFGFSNSRGFW